MGVGHDWALVALRHLDRGSFVFCRFQQIVAHALASSNNSVHLACIGMYMRRRVQLFSKRDAVLGLTVSKPADVCAL